MYISKLIIFLDSLKKTKRDRKRKVGFNQILMCIFSIADNGIKSSYINEFFHIQNPKSTYYYYFNFMAKHNFSRHFTRK